MNGFSKFILDKLSISSVYLVFDRYCNFGIKNGTRKCQAGSQAARYLKFRPDTPLPSRKVMLNVAENKSQLIDLIIEQLLDKARLLQASNTTNYHKVVVTGSKIISEQISMGIQIRHDI